MAKRIPGFGPNKVVQKRVSRRKLDGLCNSKENPVQNTDEAAKAIIAKLIASNDFAVLLAKMPATVEYSVVSNIASRDYGALLTFQDVKKRLRIACTVKLDSEGKAQCEFSRSRGDAVSGILFMRKFDKCFEDDETPSPPPQRRLHSV